MRRLALQLAAALAAAVSQLEIAAAAPFAAAPTTSAHSSLHQFYAAWFQALEDCNTEGTLALLHSDFVIKGPLSRSISDQSELIIALNSMHLATRQEIDWALEESSIHGDWAWARVTEATMHIPKSGAPPKLFKGSHLSILRKSGGSWKMYRDQASLDELPSGSSGASGAFPP